MRVGIGYDVHKLVKGRKLILGGEEINFHLGLLGHSDADVLIHAIMDSLLGALALGDIGVHFPDNDESYKNVDSRILLRKVGKLLEEKNYKVSNIDAVVVCEKPKLRDYIPKMIENISNDLNIEKNRVSIKATTEEGLGFTGVLEGISSHSVCLIEEIN